jgi:hypothetical protein
MRTFWAMVGARIKPEFEAEARERQKGGQGGVLLFADLQKATPTHSHFLAAEAVGVSLLRSPNLGSAKPL